MKNKMFRLFALCVVSCLTMGVGAQKPVVKGVKGDKNASKAVKARVRTFKPKVNVPAVIVHEAREANEAYSKTKKKVVNRSVLPDVRPRVSRKGMQKASQPVALNSMLSSSALHFLDSVRREVCVRRFVKYAKTNSLRADSGNGQGDALSSGQQMMAELIEQDLRQLAMDNKNMQIIRSEDGCMYVKFPATTTAKKPSLVFTAHLGAASNDGVEGAFNPIVHRKYRGGDISLPSGIVLSPNAPQGQHLKNCVGKTIVTGDGVASFGVDGTTGCVVLMSLIDMIAASEPLAHGGLCFVFSPNAGVGTAAGRFEAQCVGGNPDVVIDVDGSVPDSYSVEETVAGKHMQPTLSDIIKNSYAFCGKTATLRSERDGATSAVSVAKGALGDACVFSGQQAGHSAYEWTCVEDMLDMVKVLYGVIVQVKNM